MNGLYVVFEGNDGAGKTTTMEAVSIEMKKRYPGFDVQLTHQPGSTPLGKHIRKLVKYPEEICKDINIDDLSRQMLYMVDTVNFIKTILEPSLSQNKSIFSDRSTFISAIVYGLADGLDLNTITKLFEVITPPKMDKLYILQCPISVSKERIVTRGKPDHYDRKPEDLSQKRESLYQNLITNSERALIVSKYVSLNDIKYIDTSLPLDQVVKIIADDLSKLIQFK